MSKERRIVNKIVSKINARIRQGLKSGFLKSEYFTTWDYNKGSEAHSRILGTIVHACFDLGYDVEIERRFGYSTKEGKKQFVPDLSIYKKKELFAVLEYESTNSSDWRFYDADWNKSGLRNIGNYKNGERIPKYWINIFTLPNHRVSRWKNYAGLKKNDPEFKKLLESPYKFFFPTYKGELKKTVRNVLTKTKLSNTIFVLLNIDTNEIKQEYVI